MINALVTLAARFTRPSTDKALKGFSKALDGLDAVVAHEDERIAQIDAKKAKLADQRLTASISRARASKLSAKFYDLLNA